MTQQTSKNTGKPKEESYISFNFDELAALEKLGFRERWAYIVFKRLANFKTGVVGEYLQQRLSYRAIADLIKPPPGVQGRGEGRVDETQARDFILRMEAEGLVSGIGRRRNGGLRFDLPMSPKDRKKPGTPTPYTGEKAIISPETSAHELAGKPDRAKVEVTSASSPSVMIHQELKNIITDEAAEPSADIAASCRAFGANPCRAFGAAALRENPRAVAAGAAPLTAQQIYSTLAESWVITETNTPQAWQLYEAWAGAICLDDLHEAMTSVEERDGGRETTPSDLMPYLLPVIANCHPGQSSA